MILNQGVHRPTREELEAERLARLAVRRRIFEQIGEQQYDVHTFFSLSYANFLVVPRCLLQSMPLSWQHEFTALMDELDAHFEGSPDYETPAGYRVQPTDAGGKLISWRSVKVPHYNRGRTFIRGGEFTEVKERTA
jgi:hypothetical protein